jgi:hypothetical protein
VHWLPSVFIVVFRGVHVPPDPQVWLQHWPLLVQAPLSEMHGG